MNLKKYKMYNRGETAFNIINTTLLLFLIAATIYPFLYIFFGSMSDPIEVMKSRGYLWFRKFNTSAYILVFKNPNIVIGYMNTLFYVFFGTLLNLLLTSFASYALSRKWLAGRRYVMLFIVFTMYFGGGLIPYYLLIKSLGLIDSRLVLILPSAISAWNMILMRTYFMGISDALEESAKIDGANDFKILFRIFLPLSKPIIAVIALFCAVGFWNSWFSALIFLKRRELYPVQLILREILIMNSVEEMASSLPQADRMFIGENLKYATIIVTTLPILLLYPFLQKYFVQGMMIGSLKE